MYNWISIYEENNLSYLSKTGKVCKRVSKVYERLQDEIMDNFGINEDYLKILKNKIKIELYYAEQIRTKNRSNQAFIDILEIQNEELQTKKTKGDIHESVIMIEQYMGFKFDVKKITVYEFYKYSQMLTNKIKHEHGRK